LNYYAFFDHRNATGWRTNNQYQSNTGSGSLTWHVSDKFSFTTEFTRWHSNSQQPGGLTDAQFESDPKQSVRSRNWFDLTWQTVALSFNYKIKPDQRLNLKIFNIQGDRGSVGYFPSGGITVVDAVNPVTGEYLNRTVDIDNYRNLGLEARYLLGYQLGSLSHNLSTGIRLYSGSTLRYRGGQGTTGTDFNLNRVGGTWTGEIDYGSKNAAFFLENLFSLSEKLTFIPGVRLEYLQAEAAGYSSIANGNPVYLQNQQRSRGFVIGGVGAEYQLSRTTKLYANASQSYRPVQFADLTTPPTTDIVDPNLTDARGLNIDLGYKGRLKNFLVFDASVFHLDYDNRIGTIKQQRTDGSFYNFRTNVGSSVARGAEVFGEFNILKAIKSGTNNSDLSVFASYSYTRARYQNFKVVTVSGSSLSETNFKNNHVEYAPENILRTGVTYSKRGFEGTLQYNYTDRVFTDANNTVEPTPNAQNGVIPSYSIFDSTLGYKHNSGLSLKMGVNNLTNKHYFTRRASGYPGPGILPADGRSYFVTLGYILK
jgi:Fe(3+) dicitrate transport protein